MHGHQILDASFEAQPEYPPKAGNDSGMTCHPCRANPHTLSLRTRGVSLGQWDPDPGQLWCQRRGRSSLPTSSTIHTIQSSFSDNEPHTVCDSRVKSACSGWTLVLVSILETA